MFVFFNVNIIFAPDSLLSLLHTEKIPRSQPPHVENGLIKGTLDTRLYAHGTKLSYICERGYKIFAEDIPITTRQGGSPRSSLGLWIQMGREVVLGFFL